MKFYVYMHLTADTQVPFYAGKGIHREKTEFQRIASKAGRSKWWKNVVAKHGFTSVILQQELEEDKAFEWERKYIAIFGRKNLGTGCLVNLTEGGEGQSGVIWTPERRAKLSKYWSGKSKSEIARKKQSENTKISPEHRVILNESRKGLALSESHRNNIGKAHMGLKRSEATRKLQSQAVINQPPVTCPHCHLVGKGNSMKRWHFKNCKKRALYS